MADTTEQRGLVVPLTAFAAGAVVAVLLGVFGKAHDPTLDGTTTLGFDTVIDMKVVLSTVIVVHVVLGCAVFGAAAVKVVAVRSRRAPGWFLPVAGGLLFTLLVVVVLTSAGWYLATRGWPTSPAYR